MSEHNETLAEIVAEIRKDKIPYSAKVAKKLDKQTVGDRVLMEDAAQCLRDDEHYIKSLADRIEAAHKREVEKLNLVIQAQRSAFDAEQERRSTAEKSSEVGNAAKLREALEVMLDECCNLCDVPNQMTESGHTCSWRDRWSGCQSQAIDKALAALSAPPHEAKWQLGHEYEYAYCSNCGHQQYVGWETRADAKVMVGEFHNVHKFCPNCGAQMKGEIDGSK